MRIRVPFFIAILVSPFYVLYLLISVPFRILVKLANAAERHNRRHARKYQ